MHTGQPVDLHSGIGTSDDFLGCRPLEHRLNSGQGRTDGWLKHHTNSEEERQNAGFVNMVVENSKLRSEENTHCPVWVGPRTNPFTEKEPPE